MWLATVAASAAVTVVGTVVAFRRADSERCLAAAAGALVRCGTNASLAPLFLAATWQAAGRLFR